MGMLPIALALSGFIFLWALLNFNSLKTKRDKILILRQEVLEFLTFRNNIVRNFYDALVATNADKILLANLDRILTRCEKASSDTLTHSQNILNQTELSELFTYQQGLDQKTITTLAAFKDEVLSVNNKFNSKFLEYKRALQGYRTLINEMPIRYVAKTFKFNEQV